MLFHYFQGMALGAALILPLGPQNAFVLNQGIKRQSAILVASLCALSDVILIIAGVFGGSALLMQSPWLLAVITWGGALFLLWYGWGAFCAAWQSSMVEMETALLPPRRRKIVATVLAVTWLNPHVYLDTFVVLGSIGGQMDASAKRGFALGAVSASLLWFYSLALLAVWLAPYLRSALTQRMIQLLVGIVMWVIAIGLIQEGIGHLHLLLSGFAFIR